MRDLDWSATTLGPMDGWSQSLRTAVGITLRSPTPVVMMWGHDGVLIYNAAYARFAGARHPEILGQPAEKAWPEIAPHNRRMIDLGLAGESVSLRDQLMILNRNGVAEKNYLDLFYSPIPGEDGLPAGSMVIVVETTERVEAEQRRTAEMARMYRLFDQAPGFVAVLGGRDHVFEFANPAYCELVGNRDLIGRTLSDALPEVVAQGFVSVMAEVFRSGRAFVTNDTPVALHQDTGIETRHLDFIFQPIRDDADQITHILVMGADVTARVSAQEHQKFLLNELNHRVKNSLAVVQSVVRQTIRQSTTLKEAGTAISARILALSRAQDILTGRSWAGTTIEAVILSATAPHGGPERIGLSGPHVIVGRRQALALSLAVHELMTNAVKYGALSVDDGRVDIIWTVDRNNPPRLGLIWTESGGPPVQPPQRRGFGMDVIERGLEAELDATVTLDYRSTGLVLVLDAQIASLKDGFDDGITD